MLARAAAAVAAVNLLIRALIITAAVICADETPIRVGPGPKTRKKYLLVACTNLLTYYFLGDRSLDTFDGVRVPGPVRRHRARPVPELRQDPRRHPPAVLPATCSVTWKTPPRPTPTRSGRARSRTPCVP